MATTKACFYVTWARCVVINIIPVIMTGLLYGFQSKEKLMRNFDVIVHYVAHTYFKIQKNLECDNLEVFSYRVKLVFSMFVYIIRAEKFWRWSARWIRNVFEKVMDNSTGLSFMRIPVYKYFKLISAMYTTIQCVLCIYDVTRASSCFFFVLSKFLESNDFNFPSLELRKIFNTCWNFKLLKF